MTRVAGERKQANAGRRKEEAKKRTPVHQVSGHGVANIRAVAGGGGEVNLPKVVVQFVCRVVQRNCSVFEKIGEEGGGRG